MKNRTAEVQNGENSPSKVDAKTRKSRRWWRAAAGLFALYCIVVLAMTFFENWLVYPIPPLDRGDWHPAGLEFEDVQFDSADGTKLHGWFIDRPEAKRAIVYCHGNGENVGMNADVVAQLSAALDASVFIFDYRGYGHSEGQPSEAGCIADGLAAQRWLAERIGKSPSDVVVMGRSLGSRDRHGRGRRTGGPGPGARQRASRG